MKKVFTGIIYMDDIINNIMSFVYGVEYLPYDTMNKITDSVSYIGYLNKHKINFYNALMEIMLIKMINEYVVRHGCNENNIKVRHYINIINKKCYKYCINCRKIHLTFSDKKCGECRTGVYRVNEEHLMLRLQRYNN